MTGDLPNVRELESIVDYGRVDPAIDTTVFGAVSDWYWSSSTNANNPDNAWNVNFNDGNVNNNDDDKDNQNFVRAVRLGT